MPTPLYTPRVNNNDDTVRLVKVLVAPGAAVRAGDIVAEVETDKANFTVEAEQDGYVLSIEQALNTLPPRDAKVLRLYFGLEGGREHTLEEIGSMLGVTRERVRQLRDRALKRLREGDVGRALGSFAA